MQQQVFKVNNPTGIHARPAGAIIKKASSFACLIELRKADGAKANARSLVSLLLLSLKHGDDVTVLADGEGEANAVAAIGELVGTVFE